MLDLTPEQLLTTTRAVRRRLDVDRPVDPETIRHCLSIATQAPTSVNLQNWHFVVVTDATVRAGVAEWYRRHGRTTRARRSTRIRPMRPRGPPRLATWPGSCPASRCC